MAKPTKQAEALREDAEEIVFLAHRIKRDKAAMIMKHLNAITREALEIAAIAETWDSPTRPTTPVALRRAA